MSFLVLIGHGWRERGAWMFTRRGKYVVKKLPAGSVVGSATTLLDAADVAMEDARKGPSKYVIEQPVIEVDVSKAYGVLASAGSPPGQPTELSVQDVRSSYVTLACAAVEGAAHYQWYINGVPVTLTQGPSATITGLTGATTYTAQVGALSEAGLSGAVSDAVLFYTLGGEVPAWATAIPAQQYAVGTPVDIDLRAYVDDVTAFTLVFSVASGVLPAGLAIVGQRVLGTVTTAGSAAVVFRVVHAEHPAQHTADSEPVPFDVVLNADTTAPDVPSDFAATPYSTSQVLLTWTNPASDAVVSGAITSGLSHVGVYRDGAFIAQVLSSATPNDEYLATATAESAWKIRSADLAGNRSAFTAEVLAGPLVTGPTGAPENFVATRTAGTTATLTWEAPSSGPAVTAYRVYFSLTENGTYTEVYDGLPTPAGGVYTYTHNSGFTSAQEPWFYVTAVAGGVESAATPKRQLSAGVFDVYFDSARAWTGSDPLVTTDVDGASWLQSGYDAFSRPVDGAPAGAKGGTTGVTLVNNRTKDGAWTLRTQLTMHTGGTGNVFPATNDDYFPAPAKWHHKNVTLSDPDSETQDRAHRNELTSRGKANNILKDEDHWFGFWIFMPGDNDPLGDWPSKAMGWWGSYSYGPQLHPTNGAQSYSPTLALAQAAGRYSDSGESPVVHPTGAPVVSYQRGGDRYRLTDNGQNAATLRVQWAAVSGATAYRIYSSVRPDGPWQVHTASTTALSLTITGLGTNNSATNQKNLYVKVHALTGSSEGPASLICPSPQWYWSDTQPSRRWGADARSDLGQWVRFVYHYRLSDNNTGIVEIWKDDALVFRDLATSIGSNFPAAHYWKLGIYHGRVGVLEGQAGADSVPIAADTPARITAYYSGIRMGMRTGGTTGATDTDDAAYQAVRPRD